MNEPLEMNEQERAEFWRMMKYYLEDLPPMRRIEMRPYIKERVTQIIRSRRYPPQYRDEELYDSDNPDV